MTDEPQTPPRPSLLQLLGIGLGMGVGISAGRELGETPLERVLISGGVGGLVALGWALLVWLLVLRRRA